MAPAGSDSSSGDKTDPYATISQAASVAMPGDTVIAVGEEENLQKLEKILNT